MSNVDRLYDNTRVKDSRTCMRYYYHRHEEGIRLEGAALPLIVGDCWHKAMDKMWEVMSTMTIQNLNAKTAADEAFIVYCKRWEALGMTPIAELGPEEIKKLEPRNPWNIKEMLYEYPEHRKVIICSPEFELLEIEEPFIVPLDPNDSDLMYIGRLDKRFRFKDKIYVGEHKTTTAYKKDAPFKTAFIESFTLDSQITGYTYGAKTKYPNFEAVWVDAALVHKTIHDGFEWIPIKKSQESLDWWLWETRDQIARIEQHRAAASEEDGSSAFMAAFPKNTNSCFDFNRLCAMHELCRKFPNPKDKPIQSGYMYDPWSPAMYLEMPELLEGSK